MTTMKDHRDAMEAALKTHFVKVLKAAGFKGSWPNWRRVRDDRADLVNIQHLSSGGTYFVNIGQVPAEGFRNDWRSRVPPEKLTVSHATNSTRVQPDQLVDGWTFGPRSYEEARELAPPPFYDDLARATAGRFAAWGESWLSEHRHLPIV